MLYQFIHLFYFFIFFAESVLRKKWKSLRDYFVTELHRLPKPRSGDGGESVQKSKWQFFAQMCFLRDIITPRQSSGNFEDISSQSLFNATMNDFEPEPDYSSAIEDVNVVEETPHMSGTCPFNEPASPSGSQNNPGQISRWTAKRKSSVDISKALLDVEREKLEYFKKKKTESEDDDLQFFKSLLPYTKKINQNMKLLMRRKILDVVTGFVCSHCK